MKSKIIFLLLANLLITVPSFALEHTQSKGLFSMDIPKGWHWYEYEDEVVISFPDQKTAAIDIQWVSSNIHSEADIRKALDDGNNKMIKQGIEAHQGKFIDEKQIDLNGIYATQLDFTTTPQNPIEVTYISFFNKGYAFTVSYASRDDKMHLLMDDAVATIRFDR